MSQKRPDGPERPAPAQATSLSLLERARANDPAAWRRLVELYAPLVRFWCRRGGVPDQDGEEVSQEVFAGAAGALGQFRRDRPGDTFRGWLRVITRNQVLQYFRRNRGRPRAEGGSEALAGLEEVADPLAGCAADETEEVGQLYRRALEQVRGEFEEKTWQAFWYAAVEARPPADLAGELGMSAAAIRQAKSRVLRRLKQEVGDLLG
jgi:RNA polymerase sigma-70 factor (ECF subfamily)